MSEEFDGDDQTRPTDYFTSAASIALETDALVVAVTNVITGGSVQARVALTCQGHCINEIRQFSWVNLIGSIWLGQFG